MGGHGAGLDLNINGFVDYVKKKGFKWYRINIVEAGVPMGEICVERHFLRKVVSDPNAAKELRQLNETKAQLRNAIRSATREQSREKKEA
jgi:hypothetical protein